jgi:phage/plasmid-like protein (TIGR03299 family)
MTQPTDFRTQERDAGGAARRGLAPAGLDIPAWDKAEYATPEASGIEVFADGTGSFFAARQDAWHQLGTVTEGAVTAEEAMKLARLDWTVTKQPVQTVVTIDVEATLTEDGVTPAHTETVTVDVPGKFATVRVSPETGLYEPLGIVGTRYVPVQNAENADALNAIAGEAGAHFETAGSLDGGRRTFISMKLPNGVKVGGQDYVEGYLIALNSHDGTSGLELLTSMIRPVCGNTVRLARKRNDGRVVLRHTRNVKASIEQARHALQISSKFLDEWEQLASGLYAAPMSRSEFGELVDKVYVPTVETKGKAKDQETAGSKLRRENLYGLWTSETQSNITGTRWAAYNAIAEYADWGTPIQSKSATALAGRIAAEITEAPKMRALALLT